MRVEANEYSCTRLVIMYITRLVLTVVLSHMIIYHGEILIGDNFVLTWKIPN